MSFRGVVRDCLVDRHSFFQPLCTHTALFWTRNCVRYLLNVLTRNTVRVNWDLLNFRSPDNIIDKFCDSLELDPEFGDEHQSIFTLLILVL